MSSRQNWTEVNSVKVNNEVLADLQAKGLVITMGEDGYPWVASMRPLCPSSALPQLMQEGRCDASNAYNIVVITV